ncbi:hypothetical protein U1Q18_039404 [Sarracenia purpurea var. burkii]
MQTLCSHLSSSPRRFNSLYSKPTTVFLCFFSSVDSLSHTRTATPNSNPLIFNYLIQTFAFPEPLAFSISNRFSWIKTLEKPQSVVQFLKQIGFLNTHIRSSIRVSPQILFADIDKTLKPKLQFFQDLGLTGADLGKFLSTNSMLLTRSLEKKLVPCVDIIKKTLINDKDNQDLIRVLRRCKWIVSKGSESRLICNIAFLKSCGIVGSQLSMLLKRQPHLFVMPEQTLRDIVLRVVDMGFSIDSRMLVHAVYTVSCLSGETFRKKLELFQGLGFSEDECMGMFRRAPGLLRVSEEKLKFGIEFFLNDSKFERSVLVRRPTCFMHSLEERVIPRYRVLQVVKSKRLLKKEPSFINVLHMSDDKFCEKFISRFRDDAEELLMAYKGNISGY